MNQEEINQPLRKLQDACFSGSAGQIVNAAHDYLDAINSDYYNRQDGRFTDAEKEVVRWMYNRAQQEEICEYLGCSMSQLIGVARLVNITNQKDVITAQDMLLLQKCIEDKMPPYKIAELFEIEEPKGYVPMTSSKRRAIIDALNKSEAQGELEL